MDINWIIAQLTPMLVRYGVFGICAVLAYLGFTEDQVAGMNGQITAAVSGFVGLAVLVIAGKLKPSVKAAEAAKRIDAELPADMAVRILTPPGQEDIIVHAGP